MIVCLRAAQALGNANRMAWQIDCRLGTLQEIASFRWWSQVGVTNALDDEPHDRFRTNPIREGDVRIAPKPSDAKQKSSYSPPKTRLSDIQNLGWRKLPVTAGISARA